MAGRSLPRSCSTRALDVTPNARQQACVHNRRLPLHVVSAILFSPRGGSAHVARALADGLRAQGCAVTLLAGSRDDLDGHGDALRFYGNGDLRAVDFGPAIASGDPLAYVGPSGTAPIHPSFEDRPGAIDRVFAVLDDAAYERQVAAWSRELAAAGAADADVLHLHHLTPLNEAAARVAPGVPIVGQLHGTELLMLEAIESGVPRWPHAAAWARRLRRWAQGCERIVVADGAVTRARDLLELDAERIVPLPSGVDTNVFRPRPVDRRAMWREVLVEHPRGSGPGQAAGSVSYQEDDLEPLIDGIVVVYVGRFTAVKQLPLLIEAFAAANERTSAPSGLVLVGGYPGEWEGEHPAETIARIDARGVFLAGWYDHSRLPELLCASDVVALTSAREQFGLVLVEGMACARPAVATRSPGPVSIITDGTTGWLTANDSKEALASALAEAIDNHAERTRRGRAARNIICEQYTWHAISARLAAVLEDIALPSAAP
jgi:glycosyltransferase involved in cell wall biosynthesis